MSTNPVTLSRRTRARALVTVLITGALAGSAHAQQIDWYTVDAGGAVGSVSGGYRLSGTAGQPDAAAPRAAGGLTLSAGFWTRTATNRAPAAADVDYSAAEDSALSADDPDGTVTPGDAGDDGLLAFSMDPEGDTLGIVDSPVSGPDHGQLVINPDGTFEYTPEPEFFGTDGFVYRVADAFGAVSQARAEITVLGVDDAPRAKNDAFETLEDSAVSGNVLQDNGAGLDEEVDGDSLAVRSVTVSEPAAGSVTLSSDGAFTYTPDADFNGTDRFVYEVCDETPAALCDTAEVTVEVGAVNDAPAADDDGPYSVVANTVLTVPAPGVLENDSDVEGDPLGAVVETGPDHGQLALEPDGAFSYTPDADFVGTDAFTYRAKEADPAADDSLMSEPATVAIEVTPDHFEISVEVVGAGGVRSQPDGIFCPQQQCSAVFPLDDEVVLIPQTGSGIGFQRWENCPQVDGDRCRVTVTQATTVTAVFGTVPIPATGLFALVVLAAVVLLFGARVLHHDGN